MSLLATFPTAAELDEISAHALRVQADAFRDQKRGVVNKDRLTNDLIGLHEAKRRIAIFITRYSDASEWERVTKLSRVQAIRQFNKYRGTFALVDRVMIRIETVLHRGTAKEVVKL